MYYIYYLLFKTLYWQTRTTYKQSPAASLLPKEGNCQVRETGLCVS